jgi:hypothetical protein
MGFLRKIHVTAQHAATVVHQKQHGDGSTEEDFLHPRGEKGTAIIERIKNGDLRDPDEH